MSARTSLLSLLSLSLLACGEGTVAVDPAPRQAANGGASAAGGAPHGAAAGKAGSAGKAGAAAGQAGAAGASPVVRTVSTRSPYGSLAADNLLWDGDLEWSGPWVSQYSWAATASTTQGFGGSGVEFRVGPDCRSGLKCATLGAAGLAAIGVAPSSPFTHARGWVRVPEGVGCGDVIVRIDGCFLDATASAPLPAVSPTPDAAGWCRFEGDRPTPDDSICLYFKRPNGVAGDFVVDDAYVGASTATKALAAFTPPTAAEVAEVKALQEAVRARVHRLPPAEPRRSLPPRR